MDLCKLEPMEFIEKIKTMFGSPWEENSWEKIDKDIQEDFISWVGEYQQQDWSAEHLGGDEDQWYIAWRDYNREYIAFIITTYIGVKKG